MALLRDPTRRVAHRARVAEPPVDVLGRLSRPQDQAHDRPVDEIDLRATSRVRELLAPDGRFMGNCGNRDDIAAPEGDCGVLTPYPDCPGLTAEFYRGGETVPFATEQAWHDSF